MIELTELLQQAVDADRAPRLIDPRTNKEYVLVAADLFERFKSALAEDEGPTMREVAALVERAMAEDDAGDPTLEYYQRTYGRRP
jgi:hypothetical protein